MRTGRQKGIADNVERRTRPSLGDHTLAFAACGTDVAGKDRAGLRARAQQRCCGDAVGVGPHTIGKWRKRFIADRIEGLYDEMRTGRPRTVEDEAVAELYQEHRPSPVLTLRSSTSPYPQLQALDRSVLRRGDVVGLYLNPPDKAVVLCVDEKRSHREWIATNALAE
jgi:putative transposase